MRQDLETDMHSHFVTIVCRWLPLAVVCAAALFAASSANAASFDCRRATMQAESTICENANLNGLDERTAGMYFLIVGSSAPPATVAQVKEAQTKFLKSRNACGPNINCLVDAYTSQMMFLRSVKDNLGP
jgi:uncharacterized protein